MHPVEARDQVAIVTAFGAPLAKLGTVQQKRVIQ